MRLKMSFFKNLQQDLKAFLYLNAIFMLYRIVFICIFSYQLVDVNVQDILLTCWYGLRISIKTAGMFTLIGAVLTTIPNIFVKIWPADLLRKIWHGFCIFAMTFAFFARIPYYKIFNSGYNLMLFNGVKDDWHAIYETAVKQYQLYPRLIGVFITFLILIYVLRRILNTQTWQPRKHKKTIIAITLVLLFPFMYIVRFGGGYNYDTSMYWENAARMKSNLLNEAIMDDGQALYRTWSMLQRMENDEHINVTASELKEKIKILGGNPEAKTVEQAFSRTTKGGYLSKQPQQVVVILGENYALWPFLERYQNLGLVASGEKLLSSGKVARIPNFLANGNGTMIAGFCITLGTYLMGVQFSLVLGFIAVMVETVPVLGPIFGSIPAVFIAYSQDSSLALKVVIFYIVFYQIDGQYIMPNIMGRSIALHPVLIILGVLVGGKLFGIVGLLFAVPVVAVCKVFYDHLWHMDEDMAIALKKRQ